MIIIQKWKEHDLTPDLSQKGYPLKVNKRASRSICWKVMHKPFTTRGELQKNLQATNTEMSKDTIKIQARRHSWIVRKTP